jgi:hypothetical protein
MTAVVQVFQELENGVHGWGIAVADDWAGEER